MKTPTSQRRNTYREAIGRALAMKQAANKDLRSAFAMLPAAGAPDDDDGGDDGDDDETEDDEDDDTDDGDDDGDDGGSDEQDDDDGSADDKVQNKRIKELSDENAKWRRKVRRLERELKASKKSGKKDDDEDSGPDPEVLSLRAENAFLKSSGDLGITSAKGQKAALKFLEDYRDDYIIDGTVDADEMKAALEEIVEEYPWIKDADTSKSKGKNDSDDDDDSDANNGRRASGRQTNGKKKTGKDSLDAETLRQKFPALRR